MWSRCRPAWTSFPLSVRMDNVFVRYLAFPNRSVKAATFPNDDGSFDVYVNTLCSEAEQRKALAHELRHIELGHFYSEAPIAEKEAQADGLAAVPAPPCREVPVFPDEASLAAWLLRQ